MIRKLLGHSQIQTTARYAHLARNSVKTAAVRISDSLKADMDTPPDGLATSHAGALSSPTDPAIPRRPRPPTPTTHAPLSTRGNALPKLSKPVSKNTICRPSTLSSTAVGCDSSFIFA